MLPSVSDVLAMPVVRAGAPEVVAGGSLDRPVRWVHVSEVAEVAQLLAGGELILTTGQPMSHGDSATAGYLTALAAAGVSGLVVELGAYVPRLPPIVAQTADALGLPVIALHRVTRFVEITEAVHRVIVADQYAEVEFARNVHETFTDLSVRRASLAEIVKTAAGMLDSSVVLEDLAHRVLAFTAKHASTSALLEDWENISRLLPDGWDAVAVGPHTQRWGRLILRSSEVPTARATMVLERAAQTLTLHRMIEKDRFGLHRQAQTGLIDDMVNGRVVDERDAVARAAALGLARRAAYVPLAVDVAAVAEADPVARQRRAAGILDAITHGLGLAKLTALAAADQGDRVGMILALPRTGALDENLTAACVAIAGEVRRVDGVERVVIGVGAEADSLLDTAHELPHAAHIAEVALSLRSSVPRPFYRSGDVRLRGLLSLIRNEPGVQRFAETELSALLRYDIRQGADLTGTLRQFLDLAGNKTELARRLTISRPTLYERLARIERILAVDLEDGESRTSLHAALLIRDLTANAR
ncbi:putative CdaR family transcriptional regulator [Nocardia brasiliensis NBRC 14402]|uniref:PucR family transcriptional regulator n=1 Tax=Nocardia brasiliensis TaxID=37326 RepID=UPI00045CF8C6|nr:PucR family transcriptional regulator [Nocardia brasiliensis]ASF06103.1 PucR family transcriptional regulator [Nocardia brasiliensis]GAJ82429.1 putative CdaR family transcriptional regulator [Nocardia brasiliensis NBRC 14402]SUB53730.1 Sugar diacid utilization regulator [Nocardia brasiliensis]